MPTSFIKSTIDFRQSSFSGFFFAKSLSTAATSTTEAAGAAAGAGAEDPAAAGVCGVPPGAGAAAAACDALAVVAGAAWPKIFDIRLLNNPINLSFLCF
jgi:hypothetical protein